MSEPFIFIGTHRVKRGKLEEYKTFFAKFCDDTVAPNEPRLLSFQGYSDDSDWVTVAQVHPDASSMVTHMSVIAQQVDAAYADYLEPESRIQVYGTLSSDVLAMMEQLSADRHVAITVQRPFAGFQRLPEV